MYILVHKINKQSVFLPFLCDKTIKTLHFVKGLFLVCLGSHGGSIFIEFSISAGLKIQIHFSLKMGQLFINKMVLLQFS